MRVKQRAKLLLAGLVFCLASAVPAAAAADTANVVINEVSSAGDDWIELKNVSAEEVSLEGWHLTDKKKKTGDALMGTLAPGSFLVVEPESFSVSAEGETLFLYDAEDFLADKLETGFLKGGLSTGRNASGETVIFETPTPGEENAGRSGTGYAPAPVFSETALYHEEPFELTITCGLESASIYYTLDGSEPDETDTLYTGPVRIEKDTVVRAAAVKEGFIKTEASPAHFVFSAVHMLPVVCVDMEPALFKRLMNVPDDEKGLLEQPAYFSFYEADGLPGVSVPAGVKPRGNASIAYRQKSLSLHMRAQYGCPSVCYDFWGTGEPVSCSALILRNGSQDMGSCRLRDSFALRAAENLNVDKQHTRFAVAYVNGAYYGIVDLNENVNASFFAEKYGVKKDTVNIASQNDKSDTGSAEGFIALRSFAAKGGFSDEEAIKELSKLVDVSAATDYLIAQSFFGNYDIHNQLWWNSGSSAWRPILYDIDRCFNKESMNCSVLGYYFSTKGVVHDKQGDRIYMEIFLALKENEAWRDYCLNRYAELLCTDFSEETLLGLLDEMAGEIREEMTRHIEKWGQPKSVSAWETNLESMRGFIKDRYALISKQICGEFSLSAEEWESILAAHKQAA